MSTLTQPRVIDEALLGRFAAITLERMDSIRLMNRIDTKFVTDTLTLEDILSDALQAGYLVFETAGGRVQSYDSIYFDTPDLKMYTDHRRGKTVRQKVRTRDYCGSGLCFLEVKRKNNRSRTRKKRTRVPPADFRDFREDSAARLWLSSHSDYGCEELAPSVETSFERITLVNKGLTERLTIDTSVSFRNLRTEATADLGSAVIIELKQDGRAHSEMKEILLKRRVKPFRISKYCMGVVLTDSGVIAGRFKQKIRDIDKVNKNCYIKCYRPTLLQPL